MKLELPRQLPAPFSFLSLVFCLFFFFWLKSDSVERHNRSFVYDSNLVLITYKALNFTVVFRKLAEYPFNASPEVPRTAPFRHLTAARLSSFCLTVLARSGLTLRQSNGPRAQVFFFLFLLSWCGSCLFSAILGTCSACNKLLKWRPLACLLSLCLPQPIPPTPYRWALCI